MTASLMLMKRQGSGKAWDIKLVQTTRLFEDEGTHDPIDRREFPDPSIQTLPPNQSSRDPSQSTVGTLHDYHRAAVARPLPDLCSFKKCVRCERP